MQTFFIHFLLSYFFNRLRYTPVHTIQNPTIKGGEVDGSGLFGGMPEGFADHGKGEV